MIAPLLDAILLALYRRALRARLRHRPGAAALERSLRGLVSTSVTAGRRSSR